MTVIPVFSVHFQHILAVIPTDILQSSNMYSKIIAIVAVVKNVRSTRSVKYIANDVSQSL
jgi:hypothetical protein